MKHFPTNQPESLEKQRQLFVSIVWLGIALFLPWMPWNCPLHLVWTGQWHAPWLIITQLVNSIPKRFQKWHQRDPNKGRCNFKENLENLEFGNLGIWEFGNLGIGKFGNLENLEIWEFRKFEIGNLWIWKFRKFGNLEISEIWKFDFLGIWNLEIWEFGNSGIGKFGNLEN